MVDMPLEFESEIWPSLCELTNYWMWSCKHVLILIYEYLTLGYVIFFAWIGWHMVRMRLSTTGIEERKGPLYLNNIPLLVYPILHPTLWKSYGLNQHLKLETLRTVAMRIRGGGRNLTLLRSRAFVVISTWNPVVRNECYRMAKI